MEHASVKVVVWNRKNKLLNEQTLFKHAGKEVIAVWLQTTALNFPMAFFWQIFFAGPLVRTIFGMIFKEKEEQVMKEESEFLEGGSVRN